MGAESKSRYIDEEVKKMTAYHEGGHALVALYTDGAMPLHKVTCVPRGHALGVVRIFACFVADGVERSFGNSLSDVPAA